MPQTNYYTEHLNGYAGTWAGTGTNNQARPFINTGASEIPFGCGVVRNTTPTDLKSYDYTPGKLPASNSDVFVGVAVHSMTFEAAYGSATPPEGVAVNKRGDLAYQGAVNVKVEGSVTPESSVYLRVAANGVGTAAGQFTGTADGTNTIQITNARWEGRSANGICGLRINLP